MYVYRQKARPRRAFLAIVNKAIEAFPDALQLHRDIEQEFTPTAWRTWDATLGSFLDPERATLLKNVPGLSVSTASRHLDSAVALPACKRHLWRFQVEQLHQHARQIRRSQPWMVIRVDLTSVEKTGQKLPYVRTYNKVHGLHLVVLHVSIGKLSFPMGCEIYDPAYPEVTPILLALRLIKRLHPYGWGWIKQFVVMDSGFYSADIVDLLPHWGFEHVSLGGKSNLRLRDGRRLGDVQRGECIELDTLPGVKLYASWFTLPRAGQLKKFYVLDTLPGGGRTLTRRHKRRWLIESFFKSAKYDFGLNEIRLRSETGTHNWLCLVWLSLTLALFMQAKAGMTTGKRPSWVWTLSEAASWVRNVLMPHWTVLTAQIQLARVYFRQTLSQTAYLGKTA